jgi:hypothetical protein
MRNSRILRHLPLAEQLPTDHWRPRTRGDCATVARPCVYVGCKHNLYLSITKRGDIVLNFPKLEPEDMGESCVLDVAEQGETFGTEIGAALGMSKQAVAGYEESAIKKLRAARNRRVLR